MVDISDVNMSGYFLLLEMTFQTKRRVAFVEQSLVHGAVGRVADHTTLTHCLVLVNKWTALRRVAFEAGFVSAQKSKTAGLERLLNIRAATFGRDSLMGVVTIGAAHSSLEHRVMMRQLELCANFEVTLETCLRRLPRIDDRVGAAAALDVQTARAVARFAADVLCVLSFRLQSRVRGCAKVAHDLFVAGRALLRADELCTWDAGRRQNCSVCRAARKQNYSQRDTSSDRPPKFLTLPAQPSS